MAFQFQCPQEHLLEGDETQAGQAINCPVCGMLFIVPEPIAPPATAAPPPEPSPPEPDTPPEPELLHIPCPNGHELEVPLDMLDTEVLCPHCNAQFLLRAQDSIEHRRRREQEDAIRDAKANKFYIQFAIGVAAVVVLLLLTLMVMSLLNKTEREPLKPAPKTKPKVNKKAIATTAPAPAERSLGTRPLGSRQWSARWAATAGRGPARISVRRKVHR
jgi:DNA-directed RNA polymerase subunit RPC12/RpoP